ncbi:PucR family transcriptional regulator [Fictibacillus gelatini]|uniref:PucR family transcriptional regulator n=1 Tax=Fictibacillus gelatini TaxID=225985 RepID=UPI0004070439|nr:PucR family transcriptional regulator [Fictibacillus gelatini]
MKITLAEALEITTLNQCNVVAGKQSLDRPIHSVNSFDAPDVLPWLKSGELVLTTGYVFKSDEIAQVELIHELAKRRCAGLGIQMKHFMHGLPAAMLKAADDSNLPLFEIPNHLSISDLMLSLLRELLSYENKQNEQERKKVFFSRLLQGHLHGKDAIFAEGREFGLLQGAGYICLSILEKSLTGASSFKNTPERLSQIISTTTNISFLSANLEDTVIILQSVDKEEISRLHSAAFELANHLANEFPGVTIGIGTCINDVLEISKSYKQAKQAITLGTRIKSLSKQSIYDYTDLQSYDILQHVPDNFLSDYMSEVLDPLLQYDRENQADLLETLEVYLSCCGRSLEAARNLGVHRNTINFRITKIKELLGANLDEGETVFRLQMALRILHLLQPTIYPI